MTGATPRARKLLDPWRLRLRIAAASIGVLVFGAWLQPPATPDAVPAAEERAAPLLEAQVQQRVVERPFTGIPRIAGRLEGLSVAIAPPPPRVATADDYSPRTGHPRPSGSGVFVDASLVLTHADALAGRSPVTLVASGGTRFEGTVVAYEPATGLALMQTGAPNARAATVASAAPEVGALVVAAGVRDAVSVSMPAFVGGVAPDRYLLSSGDALGPGMPVFTADGELFGIADGAGTAIGVPAALDRLRQQAQSATPRGSIGLALQDVPAPLQQAFGAAGALVSSVVPGGPADRAGLEPGDVIVGVGGRDIVNAADAIGGLSASNATTPIALRVRRAGNETTAEITPVRAFVVAMLARAAAPGNQGVEAHRLLSADERVSAGIPPDAIVVSVGGRPVASRVQLERVLAGSPAPAPVLVEHNGRRYFVALGSTR